MPQLDPTWFLSQIFWLCLCFGFLYFVVAKFLLPKMLQIAKKRQDKIDGYITQAQALKDEAENILKQYETSLEKANKKAQATINKQKEELEDLIDKKQNEANNNMSFEIKKAEENILKIKDAAIKEVESVAKSLSKDIIKKLDL